MERPRKLTCKKSNLTQLKLLDRVILSMLLMLLQCQARPPGSSTHPLNLQVISLFAFSLGLQEPVSMWLAYSQATTHLTD